MRDLVFSMANVTEVAAVSSYPWIGKGNKIEADRASTEAMRQALNKISFNGRIAIGEGEMDQAPMLFIGEKVGTGQGECIDLAVDPLDGTTPFSKGQGDCIAVLAGAPSGKLLHAPDMYMKKIAVGPEAKGQIHLDAPIEDNIRAVAKAKQKSLHDVTVIVQDRHRHTDLVERARAIGAKVKLFQEVDVTAALAPCLPRLHVDLFIGTGGAPEGVVAAAAIRSLEGDFQGRLLPENNEEFARCKRMGLENPTQLLQLDDLVASDDCFFVATGVTDGLLVNGVSPAQGDQLLTETFMVDGVHKSIRILQTTHSPKRLSHT
ncbi:class II fructose-bisphosphatase [Shouchella sp. JSM 1781072]|uniref:class II fructose-bisphosphatase n=1 Tax=Shouchella sp. JSM 1781072 TaxID=3344581 RepID=UPI0035C049A3